MSWQGEISGKLFKKEHVDIGVDILQKFEHLSKVIYENKNAKQVSSIVSNFSSLLEILNSPIAQIIGAGIPFISIGSTLLRVYQDKAKRELTIQECSVIISQAAYLQSFSDVMSWKDNSGILDAMFNTTIDEKLAEQIRELGNVLESEEGNIDFDTGDATNTLRCFNQSKLAKCFNNKLVKCLQQAGLSQKTSAILSQQVTYNTHRQMVRVVADSDDNIQKIIQSYISDWQQDIEKYNSIDNYINTKISTLPYDFILREQYKYKDLYVPLNAKIIIDGELQINSQSFNLTKWVKTTLLDASSSDQTIFIQGGPGRGKSFFCRIFADQVRQLLFPIWIPILIRLRDINTIENNIEKTLQNAVARDFALNDSGWLTDNNTRYLFILDGFDELILEDRNNTGLQHFIKQINLFQKRCSESNDMGHRIIITGRPLALQGIERSIAHIQKRVEIMAMDKILINQWITNWEQQVGENEASNFKLFLENSRCPKQIRELSHEPLLLYLLAVMHRDSKLTDINLETNNNSYAKVLLYRKAIDWVLTKQRPDWLNEEIAGYDLIEIRKIITEAAFCVTQNKSEMTPIEMVKARLVEDDETLIIFENTLNNQNSIKNAFVTFYIKATKEKDGSIEFMHKSFREYLTAEKIHKTFMNWTETSKYSQKYIIRNNILEWEVYDIFGFGKLTSEIIEYITTIWEEMEYQNVFRLYQRLQKIYFRWCNGNFIDVSNKTTLPQQKSEQLKRYGLVIGQRSVDIYCGVNILIILFEIHRYILTKNINVNKIRFHPCTQEKGTDFNPEIFQKLINYSNIFPETTLQQYLGRFLYRIDLRDVNLKYTNLQDINFYNTDFSHANLTGSDLSYSNLENTKFIESKLNGANLCVTNCQNALFNNSYIQRAIIRDSNLSNSDLTQAKLNGSDLSRTKFCNSDFSGASLRGSYLKYADLSGAILTGLDISYSNLDEIKWNEYTNWSDVIGLETTINKPEKLEDI